MSKREYFAPGQVYHVYNRGVDKRKIFLNEEDHLRFIHNLFEFNDQTPAFNMGYSFRAVQNKNTPPVKRKTEPRKLLVDILAFCLMPNHFHLLLRPRVEGGVTLFMHKLGAGYANYFNLKYERSGALFQGRYKSVLVNQEPHFIYLPFYIHLNPLDLATPEWRNKELKDYKKATKFLESYRWSSYLDYIGKPNFPSVTQRDFLLKFFEGPQNYKSQMDWWLKELSLETISDITLE